MQHAQSACAVLQGHQCRQNLFFVIIIFSKTCLKHCAVYEPMWEKNGRTEEAIDDHVIRRMPCCYRSGGTEIRYNLY